MPARCTSTCQPVDPALSRPLSDDEEVDYEALREACFAAEEERRTGEAAADAAAGAAGAGAAAAPAS